LALVIAVLALGLFAPTGDAEGTTLLDYITFDGIDYIRWAEEPGRALTRDDLGPEFAVTQCSFGEDLRGCPYGVDASAAFLPSGTRVHAVRGHSTEFRLAALWKDRIFLYQAWRNPRARLGADLLAIGGRVRALEVQRGEDLLVAPGRATPVAARDAEVLVDMILRAAVRKPLAHPLGEPRYWLTFWLADGTSLSRAFFRDTAELMGGVALPAEFASVLERYLKD
jgi:hypothetical protein